MQKYKKAALSIAFLTLLLSGGLSAGHVEASETTSDKDIEKEERILDSFEYGDYEMWKKIVSHNSKISNIVDKDDFDEFILARKLTRAGEYDKAIRLAEKLELDLAGKLAGV